MKKAKDIQTIYDWAVDYLQGDDSISQYAIINKCADIIKDVPELNGLWSELAVHINMWGADTFEEQYEQGGILLEEIVGYLGEWLSEN